MNVLILQFKKVTPLCLTVFALGCFAFSPKMQAAQAPETPDPGAIGGVLNTADGDRALQAVTAVAVGNSAFGAFSMFNLTTGNFNTAVGAGALDLNNADSNTAVGAAALLFNTTGTENTASGTAALENNTTGEINTANGTFALFSNTIGSGNTAVGATALLNNTGGGGKVGGSANTAVGVNALGANTTGALNTAVGLNALANNIDGVANAAFGREAGSGVTTADNVICIGASGADVDDSCYIGNIHGATIDPGTALPVGVDATGKLGTILSSQRFKHDIKPMDKSSEAILALKPVTFRYNQKIDPKAIPQFGLVAEDVEKVNPDLVVRDKEGKPYTVRYDQVNAMLLNEFLKEHRKNEQQEATITQLKKELQATAAHQQQQIQALTAGLQKVSAQLEVSKPAAQTVLNNQ
jgi:Chaperone of endosialidase